MKNQHYQKFPQSKGQFLQQGTMNMGNNMNNNMNNMNNNMNNMNNSMGSNLNVSAMPNAHTMGSSMGGTLGNLMNSSMQNASGNGNTGNNMGVHSQFHLPLQSSSGTLSSQQQQQLNAINSQVNSHMDRNQMHHAGAGMNIHTMSGNMSGNNMGGNMSGNIGNNMSGNMGSMNGPINLGSMSGMGSMGAGVGGMSGHMSGAMNIGGNMGNNMGGAMNSNVSGMPINMAGMVGMSNQNMNAMPNMNMSMGNMNAMSGGSSGMSSHGTPSHMMSGHSGNQFNQQHSSSGNQNVQNHPQMSHSQSVPHNTSQHVHASHTQSISKNKDYIHRPENFAQLVSQIQFIHGDAEDPQKNTVRVIEQYVRQKMMKMIIRARENMLRRMTNTQATFEITLDDFAFLNRHRFEKLTRFHTYLSIKKFDIKEKEKRDLDINIDSCLHRGNLDRLERILTLAEDEPEEQEMEKPPRNMFLIRDNVDEKRARAAKQLVKDMNQTEFSRYSKCGVAVFKFSQDAKKFREWLKVDEMNFAIHPDTLESLSYLAYELVALVTQTALLVKRNAELYREDTTSQTISVVTGVLDDAWKSNLSTVHLEGDDSYDVAPSTRRAIQPGHVFEAIRRLETNDQVFCKNYEFL